MGPGGQRWREGWTGRPGVCGCWRAWLVPWEALSMQLLPRASPTMSSSRSGGLSPAWAPQEGAGHMVPLALSVGALAACPMALGGEGRVFAMAAVCRSRAGVSVRAPAPGWWSKRGCGQWSLGLGGARGGALPAPLGVRCWLCPRVPKGDALGAAWVWGWAPVAVGASRQRCRDQGRWEPRHLQARQDLGAALGLCSLPAPALPAALH